MSEGNDNPQDPRPEFFGNYIIKALKVKSEKWFRLMVTEEQGTKVYNFLDNPECTVLIIFQVSTTLKLYVYIFQMSKCARIVLYFNFKKICFFSNIIKF